MKRNFPKIKNSYKIITILFFLLGLLLIGSIVVMGVLLKKVQTTSTSGDDSYIRHYAFISNDDKDDFWRNVYLGARQTGEPLGAYVENFGDNLTAQYSRNELLQIAIDSNVDGIILDGDSDDETVRLIDMAAKKGIPVITVFDDCAESQRISYVGISSYTMGRQYGEKLLSESGDDVFTIYIMMDSAHENSGQDIVVSGISDVFEENGVGDTVSIEGIYIDAENAFSAEEEIRDIFLREELPDAIVALNATYTRCLFQAAVDYNRVGDVRIYGFYDSTDILDAVGKNLIDGTVSVDTYNMGSLSVLALEEYYNTGYVSAYMAQDTRIIEKDEANTILYAEEDGK